MISSGGMPSSHSATVTALAVAIGLEEGVGAPAFAIAVVLACVVSLLLSSLSLHFKCLLQYHLLVPFLGLSLHVSSIQSNSSRVSFSVEKINFDYSVL